MKKLIALSAVVAMCLIGTSLADALKVVSYNIHHAQGMDGKLDLGRIANVMSKYQPDFIALQEVDQRVSRSGKVDQASELAKQLGMTPVFGKCIDLGGGAYGNAVLSKHPVVETKVHRLPGKGEQRVALEVIAEVQGRKLSFVSVHLDHQSEATRLEQVAALQRILSEQKHPVMVMGDLNAQPGSETMKQLAGSWKVVAKQGSALTYPANQPKIEIDYLLLAGWDEEQANKVILKVGDEAQASDHRPLFGEVPWKKE
ncbi:endonuclease/exonuclease/phosphatase family protein [Verrucomicrobiaceae bacterium N1E253]|uniref:Endonuclease/exonuclease/phosphatase family protein n=1 Tax=Oceaniferula marina TaxID=2748318 RepID=A0A851GA45_9BACT|nr:endonuclease/exonuclease/phosphatase family protein [Oceaniferula marina]NWK54483.1 endonuclease/exonuclease/phosphatase family protein [Oceaniferula marina]